MEMLGGAEERVVLNMEDEERAKGDTKNKEEIEDITKEELIETLKKLKRAKAPGEDGIENKAWRFMPKEIGEEFWKLINRVWKGEGIPGEWNNGMISSIYKKGEK